MAAEDMLLNNAILEEFLCPVCLDYMHPPIKTCIAGHNYCSKCDQNLLICPCCRGVKSRTRNYALENIHDKLLFPCKNSSHGCMVICKGGVITEHEENCAFKPAPITSRLQNIQENIFQDILAHDTNVTIMSDDDSLFQSDYTYDGGSEISYDISNNSGDDNAESDNGGSDNDGSDNGGSDNEGSDNGGSDNEGSDNEESDNEESDVVLSDNDLNNQYADELDYVDVDNDEDSLAMSDIISLLEFDDDMDYLFAI